jgi:hypothetical protein
MIEGYIKGARNTLTLYRKNKRDLQMMSFGVRVIPHCECFLPQMGGDQPVPRIQDEEK